MKVKIGMVILSVLSLLGAFMPLASNGTLYVYIHHLSGLVYLLYVIPVALLALSIINIYKEIKHIKVWLISVSSIGLLILVLGTISGINTVNAVTQQVLSFQEKWEKAQEDFKKMREEFRREWENFGKPLRERPESKQETITKENQPLQSEATSQQAVIPSANPGVGAYLLALSFVGIIFLSFVPGQVNRADS